MMVKMHYHLSDMRVAYLLTTPRAASYRLGRMILPQLEAGVHGVEVVAIFFFDDNVMALHSLTITSWPCKGAIPSAKGFPASLGRRGSSS